MTSARRHHGEKAETESRAHRKILPQWVRPLRADCRAARVARAPDANRDAVATTVVALANLRGTTDDLGKAGRCDGTKRLAGDSELELLHCEFPFDDSGKVVYVSDESCRRYMDPVAVETATAPESRGAMARMAPS